MVFNVVVNGYALAVSFDVSLFVMLSVMLCGVWLQSTAMSSQS